MCLHAQNGRELTPNISTDVAFRPEQYAKSIFYKHLSNGMNVSKVLMSKHYDITKNIIW
jgi:hypothetical protein